MHVLVPPCLHVLLSLRPPLSVPRLSSSPGISGAPRFGVHGFRVGATTALLEASFADVEFALPTPAWAQPHGGISDTSSSEDFYETAGVYREVPPEPIFPGLNPLSALRHAVWDLLFRPDGMSLRRLQREFTSRHGPPPHDWLQCIVSFPHFEFFTPKRHAIGDVPVLSCGSVFSDGRDHANALAIACMRPGPLGNPFPVSLAQDVHACVALYARLLDVRDIGQFPDAEICPDYCSSAVDSLREREISRIVELVARGADVSLRCAFSCERRRRSTGAPCHTAVLAGHIRERATERHRAIAAVPFLPLTRSVYGLPLPDGERAAVDRLAARVRRDPSIHVRRALPPSYFTLMEVQPEPSARLAAAVASLAAVRVPAARALSSAQPMAFAGALGPLPIPTFEEPARFAHRNLDPRPDGETLMLPPPVTNVPPVVPIEDAPPADPPCDLVAHSLDEVVPPSDLAAYRKWRRRMDRSVLLAERGDQQACKHARPSDLFIPRSLPPFDNHVMDFTVFPFRPLLPSRWPDRPPSTDLDLRAWRREFRSHRTFTDRQLRGLMCHGNLSVGECSRSTYLAAPHGSAYAHVHEWSKQMEAERDRGWSVAGVPQAEGLITFPQRAAPTSMVERHGKWRLCHDLSWPPGDEPVDSPNSADAFVMVVRFARLCNLAHALMLFVAAGLPTKGSKFDLVKAYKKNGEQRATRWRRSCFGRSGSQSLDRTCFGQTDGPSSFSRSTHFMTFIMRAELAYADACYPSRCPRVAAFLRARIDAAVAAGASDPAAWAVLHFVMAMIDDFGLVSVDDLLFRIDGSAVLTPSGTQRTRSWLHFEVATSIVRRLGHALDPDDPSKFTRPSDFFVLLGAGIDIEQEQLVFDSDGPLSKRARYIIALLDALRQRYLSVARVTSLAFKMLVVCEMHPFGRQRLHAIFRALRHDRTGDIDLLTESEIRSALQYFLDLLQSSARIAVPLTPRLSFPYASVEYLLVSFADASGPPQRDESHAGGYGMWCVRSSTLFYIHGVFSSTELAQFSITTLEALASFWAEVVFSRLCPRLTHLLSFTDNTGAEWAMRREAPHSPALQRIAQQRAQFLRDSTLFARSLRVSSSSNVWADALSRQRVDAVLSEAVAIGLNPVEISLPPSVRDISYLLA